MKPQISQIETPFGRFPSGTQIDVDFDEIVGRTLLSVPLFRGADRKPDQRTTSQWEKGMSRKTILNDRHREGAEGDRGDLIPEIASVAGSNLAMTECNLWSSNCTKV